MKTKNITNIIIVPLVFIAVILLVSCQQSGFNNTENKGCTQEAKQCPDGSYVGRTGPNCEFAQCPSKTTNLGSSQELKKFNSAQDIEQFLEKSQIQNSGNIGFGAGIAGVRSSAPMATAESAAKSADASQFNAESGSTEFSQTNVQVQGVDEADFVKNDNKYIYTLTQNKLVIVDAYPAENAKILSNTKISGNPRNIFVNKDRLVVFADDYQESYVIPQYDIIPYPTNTPITHAYIYDISDREKPKLVKDYNLHGYYIDSRMIDNYVYLVAQENVYYVRHFVDVPEIRASARIVLRPEVYYFDNPEYNYNFNTVASFKITDGSETDSINAKTFMMGYSNTIYVSKNNIYIAYQKNLPYNYYETASEDRFYNAVVPLLPQGIQVKINSIRNDDSLDKQQIWGRISTELENMYNKMDKAEKENFVQKMQNALEEYDQRQQAERMKSVIHRIQIKDGKIEYGARGEIPGYLLNQFSMDEKDGNLRAATTTHIWTRKQIMYNNVYVLDASMSTIGKLEALEPDERIYSTRFLGDKLYMVTFKNVDPLLVVDLSDPKNPEVLGKLKIPGFSDYLHPYDENHIIGVGKETEANDWGGVSTSGVKVALFDVSDVKNPKQIDSYVIGEKGTDSEALRDHKAFLFDKNKNLLVIPISEITGKYQYDPKVGYYHENYWQGAYVLDVDLNGIKLKGKITHRNNDYGNYYWYDSQFAVRRSLFMDNNLYTISGGMIKANDLGSIDKELKTVELPYETQQNVVYPGPIIYAGVASSGVVVK